MTERDRETQTLERFLETGFHISVPLAGGKCDVTPDHEVVFAAIRSLLERLEAAERARAELNAECDRRGGYADAEATRADRAEERLEAAGEEIESCHEENKRLRAVHETTCRDTSRVIEDRNARIEAALALHKRDPDATITDDDGAVWPVDKCVCGEWWAQTLEGGHCTSPMVKALKGEGVSDGK